MTVGLVYAASGLSGIPAGVLALLAAIAVAQIALAVVALIDLYRRPSELVVLGNKWIWVAIILLANFIGPIVYLVAGRKRAAAGETAVQPRPSEQTKDIIDSLYGSRR